jgi:cytochrome c peroxidase
MAVPYHQGGRVKPATTPPWKLNAGADVVRGHDTHRQIVHATGMTSRLPTFLLCAVLLAAGACSVVAQSRGMSRAEVYARVELLAELGRRLFFDPALSASGRLACASCHDPARAYGPPGEHVIMPGGKDMRESGLRAVPSLRYLQATPAFTEHFRDSDDEGDASVDNGPTGGLTWDGRVDRGRDQARLPLLSPLEMANDSPAAVVKAVRRSAHADLLRRAFGEHIFADPDRAFDGILQALEAYEQRYTEFYPYSSKYDAFLDGKAELTASEARGLALFNDPEKGNCAHCHLSARSNDGAPPQFTDYGLAALGVPRNPEIAANTEPSFYDLGLCGPLRRDLADRAEYCGMFKSPSLRNVALRRAFFHNGVFRTLRQVMEFYVERDTRPEKWYSHEPDGTVRKFDDLPPQYHANVNIEPPFDRHVGDQPRLSGEEIDDIIAFLQTLTDGYRGGTEDAKSPRAK